MFRLQNVSLQKQSGGKPVRILSAVNLDIAGGRTTALIGPSGAGKTSLLRLLNRLDDPSDGLIFMDGKPLHSYPVLALRRRVGMFFQMPVMFPGTVAQNLDYARRHFTAPPPSGDTPSQETKPIPELLRMVGLDPDLRDQPADRLSIGQQQRVALARTLANNPQVLLLDEPTASLDPALAVAILELIRQLQSQLGLTVVMITHLLEQARQYSDTTVLMQAGRIAASGPTAPFFDNPPDDAVRQFLNGKGDAG